MVRQLGQGKFVGETTLAAGIPVFAFQRGPNDAIAVIWTEDGARARLTSPSNASDVMGNEVAKNLILDGGVYYIHFEGTAKDLLRALKAAPLKVEIPAKPKPEDPPVPDKGADYLM